MSQLRTGHPNCRSGRHHLPILSRAVALATSLALVGALASGCASSQTELPALEKDKRQLLSKDEQNRAVTTLGQKADADAAAAKQQIEGKR